MDISVWNKLFAQAVGFLSSLLDCLIKVLKLENLGGSSAAPAKDAASISMSKSTESPINPASLTNLMRVMRDQTKETADGLFGVITYKDFSCFTLENSADLIEPGIYTAQLDKSPHLGYLCPHLQVPKRDSLAGGDAGLRVHVANYPQQLKGCIAVGLLRGPDCLEHSQEAFDKLMAVLPQTFTVEIC